MDILAFLYIASLFGIGGAAFSLMWRNISDIKKATTQRYTTRTHPEAPKEGEEILYVGLKPVEPSPDLYQSLRERMEEIEDNDEDDDDGDIVVRR
tara:strand:+ start:258 stop:542 length:285 start_codon:yes stop_codon:yes gene_type:complete